MKRIKNLFFTAAIVAVALFVTAPAGAGPIGINLSPGYSGSTDGTDPAVSFSFSDTEGDTGTVSIATSINLLDGSLWATSGSLTVTGSPDTNNIGTWNLLTTGPGFSTSPLGAFWVDNVIYPNSDPDGLIDNLGLLFGDGTREINLFGNPPAGNGGYSFYSGFGAGNYSVATYDVTITGFTVSSNSVVHAVVPVPEPASLITWSLMAGVLGIAWVKKRKVPTAAF
jgi:hypothetical protein